MLSVLSVLSDIKSHPGNVSLNSLLDEISQLKQVRAIGVPEKVFAGIGVQVMCLHDHMIIRGWCVDHLRVPSFADAFGPGLDC
ncbi:hypothetical protein ABZT43_46890 [Streptomyces sp. NPDC005349]|uniref:hypothetical protein n=1 Tax=Streptomyces sp. NPDC005349 TaxID=3157037 RepID=UPI0033B00B0B